jgi:GDP-mannose 6-dehydrogenase
MMKISIFGLGYVGCVSAACLANDGHEVIGVDVNPDKVATLAQGQSPIVEPGLAEMIRTSVEAGRLRATSEAEQAIAGSDVSFICVGTPSTDVGALDLRYVERVCRQIGQALRDKDRYHTVVLRSTMLPGSTEQTAIPTLEQASGKRAGEELGVCYNPEFLREGSAVRDFHEPPRTVIGQLNPASGDVLESIYRYLVAPLVRTELRTAEMVKYADNSFHATKIAFANEIGNMCKALGVDSHAVMNIFVLDTKLNLSPTYLKPGYAFGGSCLPKDLRALLNKANEVSIDIPLLRSVLASNERQQRMGFELVRNTGRKKVGVLGLSFKQDTDDLRESPVVELVETLIGKGYEVVVYDRNVSLSKLMGANLAYIQRELPHLSHILRPSVDEVLEHAEVVVITQRDPEFIKAVSKLQPEQIVIDLIRIMPDVSGVQAEYEGIAW